jgi:serine phosphatase RsbU (regulator of sigma subunit)
LYARTIQDAILAPKQEIAKKLGDFFILSKPKDIVSGDFYFYKETRSGIMLAAADCTGHGVPAGFMSMIGNAFLNEILNDGVMKNPAEILDQLRKMVIRSLHQNSTRSENKDGMDIALLYLHDDRSYVDYAGAFNSLYLVRDGQLQDIKADMFPIGIHIVDELLPFTNNRIELKKDDVLYIFSDGYADQFGGPKGRKFMKKQMQQLLLSIHGKSMPEQEAELSRSFDQWRGELEQVDDVLVIGIRI